MSELTVVNTEVQESNRRDNSLPSLVRPLGQAASVQIEAHRAAVEVVAQVMAAQAVPRDPEAIKAAFLHKSKDPIFAEKCVAFKPIGDGIWTPSVYLATYMAANYPHLKVRTIDHGGDGTQSQVEAIVWDVQNNTSLSMTSTVAHKRKTGSQIIDVRDPAEYRNLVKSEESKTVRNAILKHMPPDMVEEVFEACLATLDKSAAEFLKDKDAVVKFFTEKFQVSKGKLFNWLKIDGPQDLKPLHIRRLKAMGVAIKEGELNPKDIWEGAKDIPTRQEKSKGKHATTDNGATSAAAAQGDTPTTSQSQSGESVKAADTSSKEKANGDQKPEKKKEENGKGRSAAKEAEPEKQEPAPDDETERAHEGDGEGDEEGDDGEHDHDHDPDDEIHKPSDEQKSALKQMFL